MAWLDIAESNLVAARMVAEPFPRSSVSRAYYAAYSAAHALILNFGDLPREGMGTWPHNGLWDHLGTVLFDRKGRSRDALTYNKLLADCYQARLIADYQPDREVDERLARDCVRDAGRIVALAKEYLS